MTRSTKLILLIMILVATGWLIVYFWLRYSLPPNAITLTLNQTTFKPDEDIILTVTNNTNRELVAENECPGEPLRVDRIEAGSWQRLRADKDEACETTDDQISLRPHQTRTVNYRPWQAKLFNTSGRYRIVLELEGYETRYQTEFSVVTP